jgi:methylenetetrahydrofolate--tRNA-(uracil-5-)-methyltransferase
MKDVDLIVIGGGLAGCEAAWQAAKLGIRVMLYEMRPLKTTGAHTSDKLAELVCSNSLGSNQLDHATGLLLEELRLLGSLLVECADHTKLPAGTALAVDRSRFADLVTEAITNNKLIKVVRGEVLEIPDIPCVIATGPLTSPGMSKSLIEFSGHSNLFFYDAIAPIVTKDSINFEIVFQASRYQKDQGDYINCPLNKDEYLRFVDELVKAERIILKSFESEIKTGVRAGKTEFFEGCLPIEVLAERGVDTLAYGPLRPTGIKDPKTSKRPHAVVQLRQDNLAATLYNIVGFQTNLTFSEQKRVFRLIPGLENAEFVRYGQMHRNTYVFSPEVITPALHTKKRPNLFLAGQIIGVEGYAGNIASGLLAGLNAAWQIQGNPPRELPRNTMIGSLIHYVTHAEARDFQPTKANYGLILEKPQASRRNKKERNLAIATQSLKALQQWIENR